jgi:hypothetical protein
VKTEIEVTHTPMPKLAAGWDNKTNEIIVIDENDVEDDRYLFKALSSDENKIDAIVRAVNSHEALLSAAKASLKEIKGTNIFGDEVNPKLVALLEKAIAQAEGNSL